MNEQLFVAIDENGKEYEFTQKATGNRTLLTLEKEKIAEVTRLSVLPHLADAKAGDDGYYVIGRKISMMGDPQILFTEREDDTYTYGHCIMPIVVLKRNNTSLLLRFERNYKVQFCVSVKDNCYSLVPFYDFTGEYDPVYDDIRIEMITLPQDATLGDFARAERNLRLERGEIRTLKDKCETSEATEYARKYPLIRIRMGWKPSPSPISHQTLENEPDMYVACSFERVCEFADELKRLGVKGAELQQKLAARGCPLCTPTLLPMEERIFRATGLYNPAVALKLAAGEEVIPNDIAFDRSPENALIYVLTGPNRGGKSVITCAIGLCQVMLQLGMYLPAVTCEISPADGIFTHFPTGADDTIDKGRLGEECARLGEIFDAVTPHSLVLLDESLSSTGSYEASYIAAEVLAGLAQAGCRCLFSTHLHELAAEIDRLNAESARTGGVHIDTLVAGIMGEGKRSFRIVRAKPDGKSYARDIAERYGLTYDTIMEKIRK